ncbi:MAG: type II toxin-antitoxin system RatA family toxin [Alphaproteobacteria bacterium]|nr:type II toxin-antitoxin system RatA family toxin [Alphaproteobacteria bacterium]
MPKHSEKRVVPYSPAQMYDLVADVNRYSEFLPWCLGSRIRRQDAEMIDADLIIGFKIYREKFGSRVELDRDTRTIRTAYLDGPFKYLKNQWVFHPDEQGCMVDFYVDFEFKSKTLSRVIEPLFNEAVKRMVRAFESRARDLYGGQRMPSEQIIHQTSRS